MAKFMYMYHNNKLPKLFASYFTPAKKIHKYSTRSASSGNYHLNPINTNIARKALPFSGASIWNNLKPKWKDLSYQKFQKSIKSHLISKYK